MSVTAVPERATGAPRCRATARNRSASAAAPSLTPARTAASSYLHPLDQPSRQSQLLPPRRLGACHFARVRFMIHAQQMQHAMEHQDAKLVPHPMPEIAGLRTRVIERDGDVAQTPRTVGRAILPAPQFGE